MILMSWGRGGKKIKNCCADKWGKQSKGEILHGERGGHRTCRNVKAEKVTVYDKMTQKLGR